MQIKTDIVVSIHYTLTDKTGEVIDTSDGQGAFGISAWKRESDLWA
jgi:FKBP-type peptidyl-prolyl cis-trans isomerase 2